MCPRAGCAMGEGLRCSDGLRGVDETPNSIDIREAVYLRMAPSDVRDQIRIHGSVTDELEAKIFERMFPAMTEEAIFWFQAGQGRGLVLCNGPSIRFVPQPRLTEVFQIAGIECLSKAEEAVTRYDPHREAVIAVVRDDFCGIAVIGPEVADPLLQLVQ
jgi:hypothetical protein